MPIKDNFESSRQHVRSPLNLSVELSDRSARDPSLLETVNAQLTVGEQGSPHEQILGSDQATPQSFFKDNKSSVSQNSNSTSIAALAAPSARRVSPLATAALPSLTCLSVISGDHTVANDEGRSALGMLANKSTELAATENDDAALVTSPPPPLLPSPATQSNPHNDVTSSCGSAVAAATDSAHELVPKAQKANTTSFIPENLKGTHTAGVVAIDTGKLHSEKTHGSLLAALHNKPKKAPAVIIVAPHYKRSHTPVCCATPSYAMPIKQNPKKTAITAAQIADLLTGRGNSPATSTALVKARTAITASIYPPLHTLDLPLGLLVLYYAAEDVCTLTEGVAAPSAPASHTAAAYSLLYQLEQLSEVRRRDRRHTALQRACAVEEAKCSELFAAAAKKLSAAAARQAAREQEVAAAELGQCTFRPKISATALGVTGKGTTDFMAKCLEWKEEVTRRLQQKYARQAELEAEEAAAAAAQRGMMAPGGGVTERSRRLLEAPEAQERLRTRPSLWEAKRPVLKTATAQRGGATPNLLLGTPLSSKVMREQEAVLRSLCHSNTSGQESSLLNNNGSKKGSTVQHFLSRVEEDAVRRAMSAAQLLSRYHNPEMERYEVGTGQQFFTPNAMPTVWKDGRRVGYENLSKEEQRDFRAELRKAGLDFVLARYQQRGQRSRLEQQQHYGGGEKNNGDQDNVDVQSRKRDASAHVQGGVLNKSQQERFMESLQHALVRREENLERVRAQATAEETFHPHLTPRSIRMAHHKIGGKPIYERSTVARDAAAVSPKSSVFNESSTESTTSLYVTHRERPVPKALEVFLARNEQWTMKRQRRLEQLAAMEEGRRYGDCTFSPNRTFHEQETSPGQTREGRAVAHEAGPLDSSREDSGPDRHRSMRMRHQDQLAMAADVRLMNELELLRSGAAFRDECFVQTVCERIGVIDKRQAMANLSLQSAPRLTSSRVSASASVPRYVNVSGSVNSPSQPVSPIARRSLRPSASPYTVPSHYNPHADASLPSAFDSQPSVPMIRTESAATQMPNQRDSHADNARGAPPPSMNRVNARYFETELPPVEDPWAALDAQTDAILKRHGY